MSAIYCFTVSYREILHLFRCFSLFLFLFYSHFFLLICVTRVHPPTPTPTQKSTNIGNLNEYISHYETLNYDHYQIHASHSRAKRSVTKDPYVYLKFRAHNRPFHIRLKRDVVTFSDKLVVSANFRNFKNVSIILTVVEIKYVFNNLFADLSDISITHDCIDIESTATSNRNAKPLTNECFFSYHRLKHRKVSYHLLIHRIFIMAKC